MGLRINTNLQALTAHKNLIKTDAGLGQSLERLSSGLRINKAADDASGLAIADNLRAQHTGIAQAISNANDGVNIIQIADGALEESINIVNTIRTKAIQAASDAQNLASRQAIQADVNKLLEELEMIGETTAYNGLALLDGSLGQWSRSEDDRFAALDALASSGNEKAQKIVVELLSQGIEGEFYQGAEVREKRREFFAQDLKSEQDKFHALEQRAQRGNIFARQYVVKVAGEDPSIFDESSRLEKLLHWAILGDTEAFNYLEKAVDINSSQNNGIQLLKLLVSLRESITEMQ